MCQLENVGYGQGLLGRPSWPRQLVALLPQFNSTTAGHELFIPARAPHLAWRTAGLPQSSWPRDYGCAASNPGFSLGHPNLNCATPPKGAEAAAATVNTHWSDLHVKRYGAAYALSVQPGRAGIFGVESGARAIWTADTGVFKIYRHCLQLLRATRALSPSTGRLLVGPRGHQARQGPVARPAC